MNKYASLATREDITLFVLPNGDVQATGEYDGMLGLGEEAPPYAYGEHVEGVSGIIATSIGGRHSLLLRSDGRVFASGDNAYGQLGLSPEDDPEMYEFIQIPGLSDVVQVSAGSTHSLFLKRDGTVWGCGDNSFGQLSITGLVPQFFDTVFQLYDGISDIVSVHASSDSSFFISADGTVYVHGRYQEQINSGSDRISDLPPIVKVSGLGTSDTRFLAANGDVYAITTKIKSHVKDMSIGEYRGAYLYDDNRVEIFKVGDQQVKNIQISDIQKVYAGTKVYLQFSDGSVLSTE